MFTTLHFLCLGNLLAYQFRATFINLRCARKPRQAQHMGIQPIQPRFLHGSLIRKLVSPSDSPGDSNPNGSWWIWNPIGSSSFPALKFGVPPLPKTHELQCLWTMLCRKRPLETGNIQQHLYVCVYVYCFWICIRVNLNAYLSTYLSSYLSSYLAIYRSIYVSVDLSIYLSIHLSTYRSIELSIYLSIYQSI